MQDATKDALVETAKAIPGAAAKATVQTAVEMTVAIGILAAVGVVVQKVQQRRAKKNEEPVVLTPVQ